MVQSLHLHAFGNAIGVGKAATGKLAFYEINSDRPGSGPNHMSKSLPAIFHHSGIRRYSLEQNRRYDASVGF
jgi:hypothetical protein